MTRIKAATMALATACLLAGCSATASQEVPRTEPYNVGQGGIEACTAPGRQGEGREGLLASHHLAFGFRFTRLSDIRST